MPLAPLLLLALACQSPPAGLARPNRALLLADGGLLVSDFHHQRVVTLDAGGRVTASFGRQGLGRDQLWQVQALTPDPGGDGLWVVNQRITSVRDKAPLWEVKRFVDGREREAHTLPPGDPGRAQWVESLLPVEAGGWLIADSELDAVIRYDAAWRPERVWREPEGGGEPYLGLAGLRPDDAGFWVVEQDRHRVRRLDAALREVFAFGEEGERPGQLRFPQDVAVCPGRWLAVADLGNYRVQRFDLEGRFLDGFEPIPASAAQPVQLLDLLISPDCGHLYLVDSKGDRVLVTTPQGVLVREILG